MPEMHGIPSYMKPEALLGVLFHAMPTGVAVWGDDGGIFVNEQYCRIFGYDCQMVTEMRGIAILPEEVAEDFRKRYAEVLAVPVGGDFHEVEVTDRTGEPLVLSVRSESVSVNGDRELLCLLIRDITEEKRRLGVRLDSERIVRHDLRDYVASMVNAARIIPQYGGLTLKQTEYVDYIEAKGLAAVDILNSLAQTMQLEEGGYKPRKAPCDLAAIVENLRLQNDALIRSRELRLTLLNNGQSPGECADGTVLAEEALLERMVGNLVKNALEASPKGGEVTVRLGAGRDGWAEICVENQGNVSDEAAGKFFSKYVTTKEKGTGLGAYTASLIAKAHGGCILLGSDGDRTVLTVRLPHSPSDSR